MSISLVPNQGATLAGVSNQVVELPLISHQSSGQSFSVSLAALCESANDAAPLVAIFRKPHLGLFLKGNNGLGDLEPGEQSGISHVGQQRRRGPALLPDVAAKPGWDHWVDDLRERPFADLREPGADICGKRAVDGDAGHVR